MLLSSIKSAENQHINTSKEQNSRTAEQQNTEHVSILAHTSAPAQHLMHATQAIRPSVAVVGKDPTNDLPKNSTALACAILWQWRRYQRYILAPSATDAVVQSARRKS
jgi:hypothetical protein